MKTSRLQLSISLFLGFLVLLILFSNIKGILFNCFHAYDFGIYQQGIFNIAGGESLNPMVTVRGLKAFNDHFMPVILLAVPFAWISNLHPVSLIVFEWMWFALFLFLVFRELKKREFEKPLILYSLGLIIFSKGILTGLEFPIHPGTWSLPIWFLLFLNLEKDKCKKMMFFGIALCLFRGTYPFAVFMLGLYFLGTRKHPITGIVLSGFSVIYSYFVYILRPRLLGETASYGGSYFKGYLDNPIEASITLIKTFEYAGFLKVFLPVILVLGFIAYKERKSLKWTDWRIPALLTISPIFAVHFLTNKFHYHYGAAFLAPLLTICFLSDGYKQILKNKRIAAVIMIAFIATASGRYTKFFNTLILSKSKKCRFDSKYAEETALIMEKIDQLYKGRKIVASGGVIQRVMRPGIEIYAPNTMVTPPDNFQLLLLLRNNAGDTYPWHKEHVEKAIKSCKKHENKVLFESEYYYLAEGQFNRSCLSVWP
ncbi:MAG: DUF2079 domain-containing protein [Bacteriovoracaceae bacterium]|nr:DUF2079 domain-containing protein [Bacteriovoracaceae bacterium]